MFYLTYLIWLFGFYIFPLIVKRIILLYRTIVRWFDGHAYHVQKSRWGRDRVGTTETKRGWEPWDIRNENFCCMQMKTNQLFRFRNLLLLVFISRMNIWLWRSFIRYTHAHGNLNSEKQSSQTLREGVFMLTNIFSACMCACVWCVCACVRLSFFLFYFFILKRKKDRF